MKKILAILLCLCMILSMAACSKNEKEPAYEDDATIDITEIDDEYDENADLDYSGDDDYFVDDSEYDEDYEDYEDEADESEQEIVIRPNGQLPEDEDDLAWEEITHYANELMVAIAELNVEKIKEYDYFEETYGSFESIARNPRYAEMYKNTIGSIVFIESSAHCIYKDPYYMYARWYTEMWEAGKEIPEKVEEISLDELDVLYNSYCVDAPYIVGDIDLRDCVRTIDGHIKFKIDEILKDLGFTKISTMTPSQNIYDTDGYAYLIFGDNGNRVWADEIASDEHLTDFWKVIYDGDLDAMVEHVSTLRYHTVNREKDDIYGIVYHKYYKVDEIREKVQTWLDENVEILRAECYVVSYMPMLLESDFGYMDSHLTDEERMLVESLNPQARDWTMKWDDNGSDGWGLYYDIVMTMIDLGVIEDLRYSE